MMHVLHLGQDSPQCQKNLEVEVSGSSPSEMYLAVLANGNWTERQENLLQQIDEGDFFPLLCSFVTPPVLHLALGSSAQERGRPVKVGPEESNRNDHSPEASLL